METNTVSCAVPKRTSKEIYEQATEIIPGGVSRNTIFRTPHPYYASKAAGCYVTDIDGVTRVDFANNMASLIHGHAHPAITDAVIEQVKNGTAYTMASEIEVSFAKLLCQRVSGFQKIRFMNSGSEAVMATVKTARAFTGRPMIAKAEGSYHGTYDFAEISQTAKPSNWGEIDNPKSVPVAYGTPEGVLDDVLIFPYNDIDRTLAILDKHAHEIACVLVDPAPHRVGLIPGTNEFIEALYTWTRKNGALLAFDEVVAFRLNYGGAQEQYSIQPDLTALGKIIGGGFPVGAVAGRADVMNVLDPRADNFPLPYSGTFSANPITMTAGKVALELYDKEAILKMNTLTQKAIKQVQEAIDIADVPVSITGAGSMFRIHMKESPPNNYREAYQPKETAAVVKALIDYLFSIENIMLVNTCTCMFSTAISQKEVDRLSEGMLRGFKLLKPKILEIQ